MEVTFLSVDLITYYTGNYTRKQKFPQDIIVRFKNKVDFIIAAENINELSRMKSMNIEKIGVHCSARINEQYRIEFDFQKPNTIMIFKISKRYE